MNGEDGAPVGTQAIIETGHCRSFGDVWRKYNVNCEPSLLIYSYLVRAEQKWAKIYQIAIQGIELKNTVDAQFRSRIMGKDRTKI